MFELACPWALLGLPLPLLIWLLPPTSPRCLQSALKVPFYEAIATILATHQVKISRYKRFSLLLGVWFFLIAALAGPRWVGQPRPIHQEGYNIMLALDISGSMQLNDMLWHGRPVTRLLTVKRAAEQFVNDRIGDKIGLILFGSRAYLQTPLTFDHHNLLMRINDASVGLAGQTTSIGDALGLAIKRLKQVPQQGRVIILLTDGVNNSGVLAPLKAAEIAKAHHIKIYTIGLGTEENTRALNGFLLQAASAELDEETLKKVAKLTGGRYFRATDMASLQAIYQTINQLESVRQERAAVRPQQDYYLWPLTVALLLFFYWQAQYGHLAHHFSRFNRKKEK